MMKGKLKQLISVLLISVLVLSMAAPGIAFGGVGTTTESKANNSLTISSVTSGHTFELYQIFGGDRVKDDDGTERLTNIIWGDGVDYTTEKNYTDKYGTTVLGTGNYIDALKSNTIIGDKFASVDADDPSAVAVAYGLSQIASMSDAAYAFAEVTNNFLVENKKETGTLKSVSDTEATYTFDGLYDGYYLLKDKDGSLESAQDQQKNTPSYTLYILYIIGGGNVEVDAKADTTTIEKFIVDPDNSSNLEKSEEYSIGDPITYQLDSKLPDMEGYESFWFVMQDTLSEGLDFDGIKSVKVGNIVVDEDTEGTQGYRTYTLIRDSEHDDDKDEPYSIYIVFNDFLNSYKDLTKGTPITVQYKVHINEYANIGTVGNDNTVTLYYSHNPYDEYDGEPDEDDLKDWGYGKTQDKKTIVYTTQLKLKKIDAQTKETLSGAKFTLTSDDSSKTYYHLETSTSYKYTEDENGLYVKVNDEYVLYDSEDESHKGLKRYTRVTTDTDNKYYVTTEAKDGREVIEGVTDENGVVTFVGLGEGTYYLEETAAPNGYSKREGKIKVVVSYTDPEITEGNQPDQSYKCKWEFEVYDGEDENYDADVKAEGDYITITVTNTSSALLPATGGIGTMVFTVAGLCAMAGAVLFLYTKKRREEL
ncbi:MAG: isopeptide-forming domain-containing fimbrial protein [Clostridiales bacterium]|nr:isopeptide-forming domain-containing fimbrial protein [Clostridiales bacterium]